MHAICLRSFRALAATAFAASVFLAAPAAGQQAAALVVAVEGAVSPEVEAFSEAEAGASFKLADDAQIILLHYAACTETHIRGGAVEITTVGLSTTGETVSETEVECPHRVAFKESTGQIAAVVLRGEGGETLANARPVFAIVGDGVTRIEVLKDGRQVSVLEVSGRLARWPKDAPALAPGVGYEIAIVGDGFRRVAPARIARDAGLTVIRP